MLLVIGVAGACSSQQKTADEKVPAAEMEAAKPQPPTGGLTYTAPAEWTAEKPASSWRRGQYRLTRAESDKEDAELAVFFFPGQGGSVQGNVDRWVRQFTDAAGKPLSQAGQVTKRESNGIPITVVDVSGTYQQSDMMGGGGTPKDGYRMLAAIAESKDGPWFFKLVGPKATVDKWEVSFYSFLDTIRPENTNS